MGGYERTRKSIRNSLVAIALQVVSLLLGFWSRKIFLDYLGTEVLGLNSTAAGILSFLNLAELGIGSAIAVTLYKPLFDGDRGSIKEIVALQGWLYRRVAYFILGASIVLIPFLPLIFGKMELPMWYAYASFAVLLFSALLGYFVNYKQSVLSADQKDYKIQLSYRAMMIVKVAFQMLAVRYLDNPYVWWLAVEALFAVIAAVVLNITIYREYPYLREKCRVTPDIRQKYPRVITMIKQLFVHRLGTFAALQSIPIFIYAYTSLRTVALYGNYMIISNSLQALLVALFTSITASVGNMIAEGDRTLILKIFKELLASRFFLVAFCSLCMFILADPFISLWIGNEYILPHDTLMLIIILFFLNTMRSVLDIFINAYGIFKDVWSPIAEAVIFVVAAILLAPRYGLEGVLAAQALELVLIVFIWKPYFLFSTGVKASPMMFFGRFIKLVAVGAVPVVLTVFVARSLPLDPYSGFLAWTEYALAVCGTAAVSLAAFIYAFDVGLRSFANRLVRSLRH